MADAPMSLKAVGDWSDQIEVPLSNALQASMEILGYDGRKACEKALVYMAKSAGSARHNLTHIAPKKREVFLDHLGEFVRYENRGGAKVYRWAVEKQPGRTWDQAQTIWNRGLARRSWMWGLAKLTRPGSKVMYGVGEVTEQLGPTECGLTLTNKLGYISKVIAPDLQTRAAALATNSLMAQAARRIESRFGIEVPRLAAQRARKAQRKLDREFRRAHGAGKE